MNDNEREYDRWIRSREVGEAMSIMFGCDDPDCEEHRVEESRKEVRT